MFISFTLHRDLFLNKNTKVINNNTGKVTTSRHEMATEWVGSQHKITTSNNLYLISDSSRAL